MSNAKNTRAQAPAREGLDAEILSITPLPDNRRTPLAAVRVRLGEVEVVFNLAALRGQRWTVRPPRDQDGAEAVFLPEPVKAALEAAIIEAANADPVVRGHLAKRAGFR